MGALKGGEGPKFRLFSLFRHIFHSSSLSGLPVELWSRFKAEFHTMSTFCVSPGGLQGAQTRSMAMALNHGHKRHTPKRRQNEICDERQNRSFPLRSFPQTLHAAPRPRVVTDLGQHRFLAEQVQLVLVPVVCVRAFCVCVVCLCVCVYALRRNYKKGVRTSLFVFFSSFFLSSTFSHPFHIFFHFCIFFVVVLLFSPPFFFLVFFSTFFFLFFLSFFFVAFSCFFFFCFFFL